jgi:hypothetical protein
MAAGEENRFDGGFDVDARHHVRGGDAGAGQTRIVTIPQAAPRVAESKGNHRGSQHKVKRRKH